MDNVCQMEAKKLANAEHEPNVSTANTENATLQTLQGLIWPTYKLNAILLIIP